MIAARDYDYQYHPDDFIETDDADLLPTDPVGQDFFRILNPKLWDFIYAKKPKYKPKGSWYFESQYPIEPRIFWNKYTNPNEFVGTSFRKETTYFVLDVDWHSQYHPSNDEYALREILGCLEDIGLCRSVIIQSSDSGGLHVYFFLPYPVHSYTLAAAVAEYLSNACFTLEDGQLELYPNPKRWSETPTCFKPLRSPLQAGSFVLDGDCQPLHNDIGLFLEEAELTSTLQDMDTLIEALSLAQDWSARQFKGDQKMSGTHFRQDLEAIMIEGWTGDAQSNNLFKKIATYGVIFQHLSGQDLVDYIVRKAQSLPGYDEFCGHQHEIGQRAKHVAKWAQSFPYTPYPDRPVRDKTYEEHNRVFFGRGSSNTSVNAGNANSGGTNIDNVIPLSKNRQHERTMEKLITAIEQLETEGAYPTATTARGKAIIAKSIEIYNEGISPNTLRKQEYRKYWHPLYIVLESENVTADGQAGVTACPEQVAAFVLPDVWQELENEEGLEPLQGEYLSAWERYWWDRECKSSSSKDSRDLGEELHRNSIYEGQRLLAPSQSASAVSNTYNSQELKLETLKLENNLINNSKVKFYLIQISSFLIQITLLELLNVKSNCVLLFLPVFSSYVLFDFTTERLDASPSPNTNQEQSLTAQEPSITAQKKPEQTQTASDQQKYMQTDARGVRGQIEGDNSNSSSNLPQIACTVASKNQQSIVASKNQQSIASNQAPTVPENSDSAVENNVIAPLQWQEAQFKFSTLQEATHKLNTFCNVQGVRLLPQMRHQLRQFLQHCLMDKSPYPALQQQAWQWFASHQELINQIKDLTSFWEYFENLVY